MKILFCVFSGTGNTKHIAERFLQGLRDLGHEGDYCAMEKGKEPPRTEGYDLLIVGYPVHAFNAPKLVTRFLKSFPKGNIPFYLLRSEGEPSKLNDASGISPRRILMKKGYVPAGEFTYVMPYNILFRHSDGMAVRMEMAAEKRIERDVKLVSEGGGEVRRVNFLRRAAAFTLRIEHVAMPLLGKTFHANKQKCVGCGACAKVCPAKNITMVEGKPKFGWHCTGCMGCAFLCPKDAVRISLLNPWRVNGRYSFEGAPAEDGEVCNYLHTMYVNYFHESEEL